MIASLIKPRTRKKPERNIHSGKNKKALAVWKKIISKNRHLRRQHLYQRMLQDHAHGRGNDQRSTDPIAGKSQRQRRTGHAACLPKRHYPSKGHSVSRPEDAPQSSLDKLKHHFSICGATYIIFKRAQKQVAKHDPQDRT
jgi:hypothetical protein